MSNDIFNDPNAYLSELQRIEREQELAISVVTQMELVVGCRNKTELRELTKFLRRFHIMPLSASISQTGLALLQQYRLSHGWIVDS